MFLAPDENVHVAHVQKYAETGGFTGGTLPGYRSTEQTEASDALQSDYTAGDLLVQPTRDDRSYRAWLRHHFPAAARGDAAGPNAADSNPPLYYLAASVPYEIASGSDLFTRVMTMRLLGVLFAAALALAAWHLAAELLPEGPGRIVATAVTALFPMANFIEGSVSPDGAMYALWAFVFLAGVKALRGSGRWLIAMVLGVALAMGVKYQSTALFPGVLLVLAVYGFRHWPVSWPRRPRSRFAVLAGTGLGVAVLAFLGGQRGWLGGQVQDALSGTSGNSLGTTLRQYVSYLWQFYLPRPAFLTRFVMPSRIDPWHVLFHEYWGGFSFHEVQFVGWIYFAILGVLVLLVIGAARALLCAGRLRRHGVILCYLALAAITLFLGLHWTDYKMLLDGHPFIQGRYFLPLTPLLGLVAGAAVGPALASRPRLQPVAAGGLLGLLVLLNLLSFGIVLERFYA